jgi:predicted extracellular nuclease
MKDTQPGFERGSGIHRQALIVLLSVILLAGCRAASSHIERERLESHPPRVLISEVLAGIEGNNNYEFIELYNTGGTPIDLQDWSLWYQLPTNQEAQRMFVWEETAFIPANGHFLLVRADEELGITADGYFSQSLNTAGGNLWLLDSAGHRADALAWGSASGELGEGDPSPPMDNGAALERLPGGPEGNGQDTENNQADFSLSYSPEPQNVASSRTPGGEQPVEVSISSPNHINPGQDFSLQLRIINRTDTQLKNLRIVVPLPEELDISPLQANFKIDDGIASWEIEKLAPQQTIESTIALTAPWTYITLGFDNIYVEIPEAGLFSFAETRRVAIKGGTIPVAVARDLVGSEVIVEGIATMYTGGYFAGSGNVKFYLEDASHGIQVWVPSGEGSLDVPIGARVRVSGLMDLYRGARELVTATPEDVEILSVGDPSDPLQISIQQATHDEGSLAGGLVSMQGTATRVEEFNYSYEMDLIDDVGNLITLYIDKQTSISGELYEAGRQYAAAGILENTDDRVQLYPRLPSDLHEVFPPSIRIEVDAPINVVRNESFKLELTVHNNTFEPAEGLELWLDIPPELRLLQSSENAMIADGVIWWQIPDIPPQGAAIGQTAAFRAATSQESVRIDNFGLRTPSGDLIEPETPIQIFLGDTVPIWAIQWQGASSPFKLKELKTTGVVTGIFPELGGFWIQNMDPDDDPSTSEGIFIKTEEIKPGVEVGDLIRVEGQVREISSQTQLLLNEPDSVLVLVRDSDLPEPVELNPPRGTEAARNYFEQFEGMLVAVSEPAIVVGPTSHFGEYVLTLARHEKARFYRGEETGWLIHVDDGSDITHDNQSTLPYTLSTGDRVLNVRGPLAYTYGNYKIEPLDAPQYENLPISLPTMEVIDDVSISVMTWNVENLFDILDPHPSDLPRPRKAEYDLALTKVANTLLTAGAPTIVALQEVEHVGVLEDLVDHPLLSELRYVPYLIEGTDSRGIDVGYLVRADKVQVLDVRQYPAPEGLTSRPPLMLHLGIELGGTLRELFILNNHFTSLAGGEAATEPRRNAQAAWNVTIIDQIRTASPLADVIILGDLNSFYDSTPLDTLRHAGLHHVYEWLSRPREYTYIFEGVSQNLDHILFSPELFNLISDVNVLHLDADYALPSPEDETPLHKSDHDPVIAVFSP